MVLDLGGGTFDVTVLEIIEGVIEIQSSAGDSRLGGEDFDEALATRIAARLREPVDGAARGAEAWARLREACERGEARLTEAETARIALPDLPSTAAARTSTPRVTRAEAEALWAPLLDRLRAPIQRALRDAGLWRPAEGRRGAAGRRLDAHAVRRPPRRAALRPRARSAAAARRGGGAGRRRAGRPQGRDTPPSTTWWSPTSRRSRWASRSAPSSADSRSWRCSRRSSSAAR